ncbi:oxygenase [Pseudogracilibacillus sp. SO30301A]
MHIIPKGIEHKLYAVKKCHHHAGEPKGAVNTGETNGELTAENDVWV